MASEVKWIKIVTDIFDDEKIKLIEDMPDADAIIVIWFKLLCLAGKTNNFGILMLADKIPFNDEMLSTIFRRPINTVRLALKVFEEYGMVEIVNGAITIPNWEKHQKLEKLETSREQTKKRVAAYRDRQKKLLEGSEDGESNALQGVTVTQSNADRIEKEKEEEIDILTDSKESVCSEPVPAPEPAVFQIILNDKTYFDITQSMIDGYQQLYPAVDVPQEIRKMVGWSESNPTKRKTRRGAKAFINNWLTREQDRGPRKTVGTTAARPSFSELARGGKK